MTESFRLQAFHEANLAPLKRIAWVALAVFVLDQLSKFFVLRYLNYADQKVILDGFFKFVHWGNTGAAWSLFSGNNKVLAIVSLGAMAVLLLNHHHFDTKRVWGQIALGLMFGGILGNLFDRIRVGHVIDFIYFFMHRRGGEEIGFPAFNVADMSICSGVVLMLILSQKSLAEKTG
jgi:signal peptidase II